MAASVISLYGRSSGLDFSWERIFRRRPGARSGDREPSGGDHGDHPEGRSWIGERNFADEKSITHAVIVMKMTSW
jgi:hypothetical protein